MDFITNEKPSNGYKYGVILVAILAAILMFFLVWSGSVSIVKGAMYCWLFVSLVFYMAGPLLGKRKEYMGKEPSVQGMRVNMVPYVVFSFLCGCIALYGWLTDV
ncbi:hypothetical protein [Alteromonas sp. S167]|uniref:hypothetical protein n=1 Tax=Alteromonas sp. S167 TaxID=3117402 RepID=UPI002FDF87A3